MERHPVFMKDFILRFDAIPVQIPAGVFEETDKLADPKIHMEIQGILKSQNKLEKERSWRIQTS